MKSTASHKPLYALPNYLYGFLSYCPYSMGKFERSMFATVERDRQQGHNVRLIYNCTGSAADYDLIDLLVYYVRWLDHLRTGAPLQIAVLSSRRSYGEEFGKHLFGKVKVYTPRSFYSGVGRTFDVVFFLDAHMFRRCHADMYHYTYFDQALSYFGYARYLFILGEYSSRSRLYNSFHAHYRQALAIQRQEPEVYAVYSRTARLGNSGSRTPLPVNYTLPELRQRPELWGADEDGDTEILLGFTVGLP